MAREQYLWKLPRRTLILGRRTCIMGILNVTPDSFSDGGLYFDHGRAVDRGKEIEQEGADLIDIGGESSRPGSQAVPEEEECRRVLSVIEKLAGNIAIPISIDTYRAAVAQRAIEAGAQIVNDISGFRFDAAMPEVVSNSGTAVVLMHSRGTRETLHTQVRMANPIAEVAAGLGSSLRQALDAGIPRDVIAIDPGIGFGKAAPESLLILKSLTEFSRMGYPLLAGTSRKSFIRSITRDAADAHTWGTAATVVVAIVNGAHIVRVHDVRQSRVLADTADKLC